MKLGFSKIYLLLFFLPSCYESKITSKENLDIYISYRFINFNGNSYDSLEISKIIISDEAKNYTFLKIPRIKLNIDLNKADTTYSYFLFMNNLNFGLFIDSLTSQSYNVINKDSFFTKQLYFNLEKINLSSESSYSYLSSHQEGDTIVKKYFLKKEIDSSYCDTSFYYFNSNLNNINFTLDKYLDSSNKSKLTMKRALYYNKNRASSNYGSVYREISISFKAGNFSEKGEVDKLIKLFKKIKP